jgi:Rrf2 family transcriptional regulator, iron-sulfur cluster assembly transcription factor
VKLSNKGRYGVQALFDIAFHNGGGPTQIREIAERAMIPARFLEQIFQELKKAGIIGAKRGPRGGYHLARPAAEISIGDVIRVLEGPVVVMVPEEEARKAARDAPSTTPKPARAASPASARAASPAPARSRKAPASAARAHAAAGISDATTSVFLDLAKSVEECFDGVTIADVVERGAELGMIRRTPRERASYVI